MSCTKREIYSNTLGLFFKKYYTDMKHFILQLKIDIFLMQMLGCQLETIWVVSVTYSMKPNQASEREKEDQHEEDEEEEKGGRERRDGKVEVG